MTTSSSTTATSWKNRTGVAARLLDAVLALPVRVDRVTTSQLLLPGPMGRISTTVELHGGTHVGRGEDISYSADTQALLPDAFAALQEVLAGSSTIGALGERLDAHGELVAKAAGSDDKPGFHRWAVDSALLDLALRQQGCDLATLVGAPFEPVRVSLSMGLGTPPSADVVRRWLECDPSITFKLDTSTAWTPELVGELAKLGDPAGHAVSSIDFKALYSGDWIDNDYTPAFYSVVAKGLPGALLEDARIDDGVLDALNERELGRLSWDYPITGPHDVPGLEGSTASFSDLRPGAVNIKPSRFGSLERLLSTIALCDEEGLPCYAGGQFELGVGRTQVQTIASLCFPDAPNDCAPVLFHGAQPGDEGLPLGRVEVPTDGTGFGWDAPTPANPHVAG